MTHTPAEVWSIVVDRPDAGFRWGRAGEDYVAEWSGVLSIRASACGEIKQITPAPGASLDAIEKVRRGAAAAFARALAGKLSLHASAVACGRSALACVGPSGVGKSTIAERLCRRDNVELLADDVAAVEFRDGRWQMQPSESQLWLTSEGQSDSTKTAIAVQTATSSVPLRWVIALRFDDALPGPESRRLAGARVGAALLEAGVRFDVAPRKLRLELDLADGLASQALVYEVARPHRTSADSVAELLARLMSEVGA
jgi:hypothetical protein